MAIKQTRKTVSFARVVVQQISEEAERDGISASEWVTRLCLAEFERRERPLKQKLEHMTPKRVQGIREGRARGAARRVAENAGVAGAWANDIDP